MRYLVLTFSHSSPRRRRRRGEGAQVDGRRRRRASGRSKLAVVSGDPGKEGMFVIRAKFPANYAVPPHHHPSDEMVRVMSAGTLNYGMGDKLDQTNAGGLTKGYHVTMMARNEPLGVHRRPGRDPGQRHRPVRDRLCQPGGRSAHGEVSAVRHCEEPKDRQSSARLDFAALASVHGLSCPAGTCACNGAGLDRSPHSG